MAYLNILKRENEKNGEKINRKIKIYAIDLFIFNFEMIDQMVKIFNTIGDILWKKTNIVKLY